MSGKSPTALLLGLALATSALATSALATSPALGAAAPAAPSAPPRGTGKSYALLIGIDDYRGEWQRLVNPVPDVRAVAAELRQRYDVLAEVLEDPERKQILSALRGYAERAYGPDDQLLVLFAGHGTYDEVTDIGYLVAKGSASRRNDPTFETLLDYPYLLALIDAIPCPRILLLVDACYSGSLEAAGGPAATCGSSSAGKGEDPPAKSRQYVTSGGKDYVPDGDPDRHTPFIRQLLAGLGAPGDDGVLTLAELEDGFMAKVEPHPRWGRWRGDERTPAFSFLARQGAAPPPLAAVPPPPDKAEPEPAPEPKPEPAPEPKPEPAPKPKPALRSQPARLQENEFRHTFQQLGLYHGAWNPEGDYPNELRRQSRDGWEVVVDLRSGLTWQQAGSDDRMSREKADAYVRELNRSHHAGFDDWRLPTLEELASLLEASPVANDLYIEPSFDPEQESCWSADRDSATGDPYLVSFNTGRTVLAYGGNKAFVRAVRSN